MSQKGTVGIQHIRCPLCTSYSMETHSCTKGLDTKAPQPSLQDAGEHTPCKEWEYRGQGETERE